MTKVKIRFIKDKYSENKTNFLTKVFSLDSKFLSILAGLVFAGVFCSGVYVLATAWPYTAPAPLDPGCAPSDPTCIVNPPLTDGFTSSFSGSGAFTTTDVGTFGAGGVLGIDAATNTAGVLKLFSAGANAFYTTFTAGTQTANATYTLPTAVATANSQALLGSTAGVLSWGTNFGANNVTTTGSGVFGGVANVEQLVIKANASQTANLQEWKNSSNTVLSGITSAGRIFINRTAPFVDSLEVAGFYGGLTRMVPLGNMEYSGATPDQAFVASDSGLTYSMIFGINSTRSWLATNLSGKDIVFVAGLSGKGDTLAGNEQLVIDGSTANVGIGTNSPGQKLTVDGTFGILEGGASPTAHTIFQGGAQSHSDITYTLPTSSSTGYLKNTSGTLSWDSFNISSYVPYTGATSSIDLGSYNLNTVGTVSGENVNGNNLTVGVNPGSAGTLGSSSLWVAGTVGSYAVNFDGSGTLATNSNMPALGDFSVSMWVSTQGNTAGIYDRIIEAGDALGSDPDAWALARGNGWWNMQFSGLGLGWTNTGVDLSSGSWTHIVALRSGTSFKIYVNGTLTTTLTVNSLPMQVEKWWWGQNSGGAEKAAFKLDEVAVYNRALTQTEITTLYGKSNVSQGEIVRYQFEENTGTTVNNTAASAGTLKLWGAGANGYYTTFTAGTQTANATYTLPTAPATANAQALLGSTAGVLSWGTNFGSNDVIATGKGTFSGGVVTSYGTEAPTLTTNGQVAVAYVGTAPRIYFYANGGTHYIDMTAGFGIPGFETNDPISGDKMKVGDMVIGMINKSQNDSEDPNQSGLHGIWVKWDSVKAQLLAEARGELSQTTGTSGSGEVSGVSTETLADKVTNVLIGLGISIKDGVTSITQLATQKFSTDTARIKKIEMVDGSTGEIYCTWIDNGEWQKVKGECGSVEAGIAVQESNTSQNSSQDISQQTQAAIDVAQEIAQEARQTAQQATKTANEAKDTIKQIKEQLPPDISSIAPISDINVDYATALASANLPIEVTANMSDGTTLSIAVTWDGGMPLYDPNTAGTYFFLGTIVQPPNATNVNNVKAAVNVILAPQPVVETPVPAEQSSETAPAAEETPAAATSELIQSAASGLLNGAWNFVRWIIGEPIGAGLVEPIKHLFGLFGK